MRLLLAEFWRFWSRRLVLISVPIFLLLSAAIAVPIGIAVYPVTAAEKAKADSDFARDHAEWAKDCTVQDDTCQFLEPVPEMYQRMPIDQGFAVESLFSSRMTPIYLLCLLIGASFIAAEFRSGTIGTWLTFNPNRNLVYLSKLAAAAVSMGLVLGLTAAAAIGSLAITLSVGGIVLNTPGMWELVGWSAVGGALFTAVTLAIGFLARHTAVALGVGIGVSFLEGIVTIAGYLVPGIGQVGRFLPTTQLGAVFTNGASYFSPTVEADSAPSEIFISAGDGALYWLALAIAFTAIGMAVFARREVR